MFEETAPEDSAFKMKFQNLSSIESLPCLNEEVYDKSIDEIRDDQPKEAEPFDAAWVHRNLDRRAASRKSWSYPSHPAFR